MSDSTSPSHHIVAGIVAHVDAGKTTLSEAMLYQSGMLRAPGRVDHGDAFLDPEAMEKRRGVTIHAHAAHIHRGGFDMTLLDTPGHVDFAADTERVLCVLDYAILVISGTDGVQGHTETLWRLLSRYDVPVFIFVNKMDAAGVDRDTVLSQIHACLTDAAVPLGDGVDACAEQIAMQDENVLDDYLATDALKPENVCELISQRKVFPVYFGSALRLDGVDEFLDGLARWTRERPHPSQFGARVYRISHDERHNRLTWIRVTGGVLKAKTMVRGEDGDVSEKIDQVRVYNGARYEVVTEVPAGGVCAITGLSCTFPGQGMGFETNSGTPILQPVLTYSVLPACADQPTGKVDKTTSKRPSGRQSDEAGVTDADTTTMEPVTKPVFDDLTLHRLVAALRELEDEDPLLRVSWVERLQELHVQLMGEMQLDVIRESLHDRFGIDIAFGPGGILYRETVTAPMEGVGHFEPLRHYAETHILIEPAQEGSGIHIGTKLSEDALDRNWQRLILTHLGEKEHRGVLIGAPLADVRFTLVAGRAHLKHTEGGDFRQATYRAVRQGLMELKERNSCRLLEPWYVFRLEIPPDSIGRAMSDIQRMGGTGRIDDSIPDVASGKTDESVVLVGECPVSTMRGYPTEVSAYTHGRGRLSCVFGGYRPCHDEQAVIADAAYDPVADLDNTPDSVFCAHGAGYPVPWNEVPSRKHVEWATSWHV